MIAGEGNPAHRGSSPVEARTTKGKRRSAAPAGRIAAVAARIATADMYKGMIAAHMAITAVCAAMGNLYRATTPMWTAMADMYKATGDKDPATEETRPSKRKIRAVVVAEAVFATASRARMADLYMMIAELYKDSEKREPTDHP